MPFEPTNSKPLKGGDTMEMTWYSEVNQKRFFAYLEKVSKLKKFNSQKARRQKEMIRDLILPTLREGQGWIPEELSQVEAMLKRWGINNWQLADIIHQHWKLMNKPLTAKEAAKIMRLSPGTLRRWARDEVVRANTDEKGHWSFTREFLIDCLD